MLSAIEISINDKEFIKIVHRQKKNESNKNNKNQFGGYKFHKN